MSSQITEQVPVLPPLTPYEEKLGKYKIAIEAKRYIAMERYNVYLTTNFTLKFMKEDQVLYQNSQSAYVKFDIESEFPQNLVSMHMSEEANVIKRFNEIISNIKKLVEFAQANNLEIVPSKEDP